MTNLTHTNDPTAIEVGYKYSVLDRNGKIVEYYFDYNKAQQHAHHVGGRVVFVTGNQDITSRSLMMNPIKQFTPPTDYNRPSDAADRIKESLSPGIRVYPRMATSPKYQETEWPIPDNIQIPCPQGMSYHPHQKAAIIAMARRGNVLLGDQQGVGKTIEIAGYLNLLEPDHTLIVSPKSMTRQWVRELDKWLVKKKIVVLHGNYSGGLIRKRKVKEGAKKGKNETGQKMFLLTKVMPNGQVAVTPITNQEKFNWDIMICSYSSFESKEHAPKTALLNTDKEAYKLGSVFTVRRKGEPNEYFEFDGQAIDFANNNNGHAYQIVRNEEGEFSLKMIGKKLKLSQKVLQTCGLIERYGIDLIVLDEVQLVKNIKNLRTRAFFGEPIDPDTMEPGYHGIANAALKKIFASGTPLVNAKHTELYHILNCLDPKKFPTKGRFLGLFGGEKEEDARGRGTGAKNLEMLGLKMRDSVLIRRLQADVLTLPPLLPVEIILEDTPEIIRARIFEKEAMREESEDGEDPLAIMIRRLKDPTAVEEAEATMEANVEKILSDEGFSEEDKSEAVSLLQETHFAERKKRKRSKIEFQKIAAAYHMMGEAKSRQLRFMLEKIRIACHLNDIRDEKIVIFFQHEDVKKMLLRELRIQGYRDEQVVVIDGKVSSEEARDDIIQSFQKDPDVKVFLGSIGAAGSGITLTASHICLFVEMTWAPGVMQQCEMRIHRLGQNAEKVYTFYTYAKDSIDSNLSAVLCEKMEIFGSIFDFDLKKQRFTRMIDRFKSEFTEPNLDNCQYNADQREAILAACHAVIAGMKNNNTHSIQYEKLPISYGEVENFEEIIRKSDRSYGGRSELYSEEFPEYRLEEAVRSLWKVKGFGTKPIMARIQWPESVTGIQRGLFQPIRMFDFSLPTFEYLRAATYSARSAITQERKDHNRQVRSGNVEITEDEALKALALSEAEDETDD